MTIMDRHQKLWRKKPWSRGVAVVLVTWSRGTAVVLLQTDHSRRPCCECSEKQPLAKGKAGKGP